MDLSRVQRGEWIAIAGGVLLAAGLFLGWYHLENGNATLGDVKGPATLTGFDAHPTMRWLLLAAAAAPLILAWIIAHDHALSWPRGQLTSVVAIAAFGLIFYAGVVDRPGDPSGLVGLRPGWAVSLVGTLLMLFGSVKRQNETEIKRKPPGTI
jgi:uncharacterized membrane protein